MIDKKCAVVGYASGNNKSFFMQHINNGMFALMTKDGKTVLIEGDASADINKVFGATSEERMPLMHDDVLIDSIRLKTAEGLSNATAFDNVAVVDLTTLDTLDPFGGIAAPRGYTYISKLAFICFGPMFKFFTGTLAMGGQSKCSVDEKKEGSRKEMRNITTE